MATKVLFAVLLSAAMIFGASFASAQEPTLHDVYQAAESGRLTDAQRMMDQVLRAHPNSAKAHFVEAELMGKQGRYSEAVSELSKAERLAPGLPFANAASVRELKELLRTRGRVSQPQLTQAVTQAPAPSGGGIPWGIILIGLGVFGLGFMLVRAMRQRSATYIPAGPSGSGFSPSASPQPYGPVSPAPGPFGGGGMGSGILGGLATGAAVGVGVVAGEALMHRMMDGHHDAPVAPPPSPLALGNTEDDLGGRDFGVSDGSWDVGGGDGGDWG